MHIIGHYLIPVFVLFLLNRWSVESTKSVKKTGVESHADDAFCFGGRQPLILSGQSGWFASPNHPQNYPNNANCQWLILSENPEMIVRLDFIGVRTEADYDLLTIYDGETTDATPIAQFDGTLWNPAPTNVRSTGPALLVVLLTDYSTSEMGFNVTYWITNKDLSPDPCYPLTRPVLLTEFNGTFQTNGFPLSKYWNYAECSWLIESQEAGGTIQMWFETFSTELLYDVVMIYDGQNSASPRIGVVHGTDVVTDPPLIFRSTRQYLYVRFYSDFRTVDSGFRALYRSLPGKATTVTTSTTPSPLSCGSVLHVSPPEAVVPSGFDLMCYIGPKDTDHLDTPCFDLIQQLPGIGNASSLLDLGGNFGCLLSTSNDFHDAESSCFDNYQWTIQLNQCVNCIYLHVCIRRP